MREEHARLEREVAWYLRVTDLVAGRPPVGTDEARRRAASGWRRVLLLGPSGTGKSYLARALGARLGLPVVHLDALFWKPGWRPTAQPEWRQTVAALVRAPAWVLDGTYASTLDLRVPAADAIVVVEGSRLASLLGVLRRRLRTGRRERFDAPAGEPLDRAFLQYIWNYPRVTRPLVLAELQRSGQEKGAVLIRSPRAIRTFLRQLDALLPLVPPVRDASAR